jgi:hypothetical protein
VSESNGLCSTTTRNTARPAHAMPCPSRISASRRACDAVERYEALPKTPRPNCERRHLWWL